MVSGQWLVGCETKMDEILDERARGDNAMPIAERPALTTDHQPLTTASWFYKAVVSVGPVVQNAHAAGLCVAEDNELVP